MKNDNISDFQLTKKKFADLPEIQILPESVRTHSATVEVELTQSEGETIQSNLDIELWLASVSSGQNRNNSIKF